MLFSQKGSVECLKYMAHDHEFVVQDRCKTCASDIIFMQLVLQYKRCYIQVV